MRIVDSHSAVRRDEGPPTAGGNMGGACQVKSIIRKKLRATRFHSHAGYKTESSGQTNQTKTLTDTDHSMVFPRGKGDQACVTLGGERTMQYTDDVLQN